MPNDAKLGMILGVGVVVVVAGVFFRKEAPSGTPDRTAPKAASVGGSPAPAKPTVTKTALVKERHNDVNRHTVAEGDTLFSLAEKYYGDKARFGTIFEANRAVLSTPDQLVAGTVLVIPAAEAD
jgi:nucleoid-associated protein YgaU